MKNEGYERNLPFGAVIFYLKKAGFFSFSCGIESFSATALERYNKRASVKDNINALRIFKKHMIYVQCGFILFDRLTTIGELKENARYLREFSWVISKGIFTVLYATEGTMFTRRLKDDFKNKSNELRRENENYIYSFIDDSVANVYEALNSWQKHYSELYDLVIDPLTAPKDISLNSYEVLYQIYLRIREVDLSILEGLLEKNRYNSKIVSCDYIEKKIMETQEYYEEISVEVSDVYLREKLQYSGIKNKYL